MPNNYRKLYESQKKEAMKNLENTTRELFKKDPKMKLPPGFKDFERLRPPTKWDVAYKKYNV
jgi:hypothetical protein